jgi:hypothetical protein
MEVQMAYASHTNEDVLRQLRAGQSPTELPLILGAFDEADHGHRFEFAERRHPDDSFAPDFPHVIYVGENGKHSLGSQTRLAKVLKTVAYVVVDEDAEGNPVVEKWAVRNHSTYMTDWVRV